MIYGRLTYRRNPETGARELHLVAPEKWVHIDMPEWRIVPAYIWDAPQEIRSRHLSRKPHLARRPKHLLSGHISCGICGGAYTMRSSDRLGCVAHKENGTCRNNRTVLLIELERRVLTGLKADLLSPEAFAEFADEYRTTLRRLRSQEQDQRIALARKLETVTTRITRVADAIADGGPLASLRAKLNELELERAHLESEQLQLGNLASVPDIHPNLPELYKPGVFELERVLRENEDERTSAANVLRSLIRRIVVHPGGSRGETKISVQGSLTDILEFANSAAGTTLVHRSVGMVVPGGGFEPPTRRFSVACSTN